ncbi:hypothetical protein BDZ94DRAFT_1232400 [Collybia nuda]|uniref:G domain-containing protein n=1 Tax=Collybia nuda TaxID=64659 RepID=A0A9P5YG99_9AGAR|nr:hypothetical protein BDZ94DRAFT_1232400 [Collybia nuda]
MKWQNSSCSWRSNADHTLVSDLSSLRNTRKWPKSNQTPPRPQISSEYAKQAGRGGLAGGAGRFRILIVGKANAGKTTILKKICNTTDEPEVYDSRGNKIIQKLNPPTCNPGFVFHDSRGFEAGGVDELQKVQDFISKRSKEKKLGNQIHVIWYCIAMSDSRPIVYSEEQFFSALGTGKVPVIAVFTKCEALETKEVEILQEEHQLSYENAISQAPAYAKKHLQNIHLKSEKYESTYKAIKPYMQIRNGRGLDRVHVTGGLHSLST